MVKIAVVDDDQGIREAVGGLVRSLGHIPLCFESGEAFLASRERHLVACVILDVYMPGLSGLEVQDRLRSEGASPPIVFLTSYGDDRMKGRALTNGAQCFLGKPVEDTVIIDCIERCLKR